MVVRGITVQVLEEQVEAFKTATIKNRAGSIEEPGILRFDILQNRDQPTQFFLYEVYVSEDATLAHKETDHYNTWKTSVESMMAAPRKGTAYTVVDPVDEDEW